MLMLLGEMMLPNSLSGGNALLMQLVEFESLKKDPDKIDDLIMELQDYLISKQSDSDVSILKSVLKEVLRK